MDEHEKALAVNGFQPSNSQVLTEGYRPQGSNNVPAVVPRLVSGVCVPRSSPVSPAQQPFASAAQSHSES